MGGIGILEGGKGMKERASGLFGKKGRGAEGKGGDFVQEASVWLYSKESGIFFGCGAKSRQAGWILRSFQVYDRSRRWKDAEII